MFKKSNKHIQGNLFSGATSHLQGKSLSQYNSEHGWHNEFRKQVLSRIDESVFKVLYSEKMGAPNSSVLVLSGMMILKEAFGWSDSQLFEQCRFNLLVRSALGLFNLNDELPTESTYYLFRSRLYQYNREHHADLFEKSFEKVTRDQIMDFEVSGKSIRMDSKLLGSNIAWYSRYEIIHQSLMLFCKTLKDSDTGLFSQDEKQQLNTLQQEEPQKTVYRSTKQDILARMQSLGELIYKTLMIFPGRNSDSYALLERVFHEQYTLGQEDKKIELRAKEQISSSSVQSPHDPESAYRQKGDQKIKGYSMNLTETAGGGALDLITSVMVEKANVPDTDFVRPSITQTRAVTQQCVETVYADGAFQSPDNDDFCRDIDMVFTGIQGAASRYDLQMTPRGLLVTDTLTGVCSTARPVKKQKNSTQDRWVTGTGKDRVYFNGQAIRSSQIRQLIKQRPLEQTQKRNNVEATIFHVAYPLLGGKSKYRGLIKNRIWAICRCMWVNLTRIIHFLEQTCQRTGQKSRKSALLFNFNPYSLFGESNYLNLTRLAFLFCILIFFLNY